ncbi:MAG TPA: hypothetical protein DCY07_04765 [Rhodospirillaceae bacterium]|nr:hypothetical protein [Rhodospirillaceae bacterium]
MRHNLLLVSLLALAVVLVPCAKAHAAVEAGTYQNQKTKHVQFNFNNAPSLKIAPKGTALNGDACPNIDGQTQKGSIRYNSTLKVIEVCDGAVWKPAGMLSTVTTCGATTVGITRFNDTKKMLEYCDGTAWVLMGTTPDTASCTAALKGKTRYNVDLSRLEYCSGTAWTNVIDSMKVVVDYPRCRRALRDQPDNYYKLLGAPTTYPTMYHNCPKDYYAVATDGDVIKEDGYQMLYVYCCPLAVE